MGETRLLRSLLDTNQSLQGCLPKIVVFRKESKGEGGCVFGPGGGADPGVLIGV